MGLSNTGHAVLACNVAVVDAQAVADAAHADGVLHRIAAALHVAADIQALDDVALGVFYKKALFAEILLSISTIASKIIPALSSGLMGSSSSVLIIHSISSYLS